jgi:diguanylate cyclase (GGDEF)-like protein
VVFLAFFVLPKRSANTIAIALTVMGTLLLTFSQDLGTVWRYVASMALCFVVINVMLNIVTSLQARLLEQSITDPLTGAFNRRHMDVTLAEVVERFRRTGSTASAMVIDIDHFKMINDRLGHAAGDQALKGLVELIRTRRRRLDMLFRQGGEEFLLLLPDTRIAEARRLAEALRESVAQAAILRGQAITVSIGVGETQKGDDATAWIKRVDAALYRAKEEGRNRVIAVGFAPWPVQPAFPNAPSTRVPIASISGTSRTVRPSVHFPRATPATRRSANT